MDGDRDGARAQGENQQEGNLQAQVSQTQQPKDEPASGVIDAAAYQDRIAERDTRIEKPESQTAEAARNLEVAVQPRNDAHNAPNRNPFHEPPTTKPVNDNLKKVLTLPLEDGR